MMNKREAGIAFLAGIAAAGIAGGAAFASQAVTEADAQAAIMTWLDALQSGDPAVVEKVLAPEFQILRSDGQGFGRQDYLSALPKQTSKPEVSGLVFTADGETVVARYVLQLEQTINGQPVQAVAPRLSVFRRSGTGWLIVAHANFAHIG